MPLHSEGAGSPPGYRGPSENEWVNECEIYLRPLAELQRWAESFEAGLKALGVASSAVPAGTLQDKACWKASSQEPQGLNLT